MDDRDGQKRDVVLGYDDQVCLLRLTLTRRIDNRVQSKLLTDPAHPFFNNIVGRYVHYHLVGWCDCAQACLIATRTVSRRVSLQLCSAFGANLQCSCRIVGRFSLPPSRDPPPTGPGVVQIPQNDGQNTLHGGVYGWDRRNWTVIAKTKSSVTYFYLDSGEEGWPGAVAAIVSCFYSVSTHSDILRSF